MGMVGRDGPRNAGIGRHRTLLVGVVVGLGALGVGTAVVIRTSGSERATGSGTTATQPVALHLPITTAASPTAGGATSTTKSTRTSTSTSPPATPTSAELVGTPPASGPVATEPVDTAPPPPPTTTTLTPTTLLGPAATVTLPPPPPPYGADALTWSAPESITVATGSTAPLTVTAHNPKGRAVSLSHPLSCTPRLDHSEVCADVVQLIPALGSATAHFTIDATGFAAGSYTLKIEGVLTVRVTVS